MNCKIGDIAVIINGKSVGKLVTVLSTSLYGHGYWFAESLGAPLLMDIGLLGRQGNIEDSRLRPLRDNPGEDETLRIITLETA